MKEFARKFMLVFIVSIASAAYGDNIFSSRHHPVFSFSEFIVPSERISIPNAFELDEKGRMTCSTCHTNEAFGDWETGGNNKWLKALESAQINQFSEGPYTKKSDFCLQCHSPKPMKRDNLHEMLDEQGKIVKSKCQYCHKDTPDTEVTATKEKSLREHMQDSAPLRLPAEKICVGCHLQTPHLNAQLHQVVVSKPVLESLTQYESDHQIYLPLTDNNSVMCITCHSPHQKGVLDINSPAGKQVGESHQYQAVEYQESDWAETVRLDKQYRLSAMGLSMDAMPFLNYKKIKHESLVRLPAKNGKLCLVCHEFDH